MDTEPDPHKVDSALRFNLAFHRTRAFLYLAMYPVAGISIAVGLHTISIVQIVLTITIAFASSIGIYVFYWTGYDQDLEVNLNPVWMAMDVAFITWGVAATGGIDSPWFVWYLTNAAAAAFAGGKRPAIAVTLANSAAYLLLLTYLGDITGFDRTLIAALLRIGFLAGASYFVLFGIVNLQEKRLLIRQMKAKESLKVEELIRVTGELQEKTRLLAEANRRTQEADRLKSQFLANMSHELRTPMNSIIGFSEILVDRLSGEADPKHVSFLRHILTSGQHLLGIINDVLDLSKIESGKVELFPEHIVIADVTESVCGIMRAAAAKQGVTFEVRVPRDLPELECDPAKFKQVLYNLLSNALKFSPPKSVVAIEARHVPDEYPPEGVIEVAVIDQGIGIAPENHSIIFDEFRQVDATARREFGGTGLGLALVKKFIELQSGRVGVESAIGKGSTFTFSLPVKFRGHVEPAPPAQQELPLTPRGERILVVEDDATAYESISRHLQSAAYIPIRARHGEEAIRLARSIHPLAITLDLLLPGADGWEVLKRLKSDPATSDIPVVIVSMIDNRELGVALGADDYFLKPVDRERLILRLRQFSAGRTSPKPRLLLIDDDRAVHELVEAELNHVGFDLIRAFSGAAGLERAREDVPDVIILDLMMPDMSGFEVAEALKSDPATSQIPILILTAKELTAEDRRMLNSKIAALVPKGESSVARLLAMLQQLGLRSTRDVPV